MMVEQRAQGLLAIVFSLAIALVLTIVPLPDWAQPYRPQWPLMVLTYWCMALPHRVGVAAGWVTGLVTDVLTGTLLGQHALGYALAMYMVLTMHQRLRLFPWWQQAAAVGSIFAVERLVSFLVTGATSSQPQPWDHWAAPVVSMALWPWLFIVMRDVRRKFRVQ